MPNCYLQSRISTNEIRGFHPSSSSFYAALEWRRGESHKRRFDGWFVVGAGTSEQQLVMARCHGEIIGRCGCRIGGRALYRPGFQP